MTYSPNLTDKPSLFDKLNLNDEVSGKFAHIIPPTVINDEDIKEALVFGIQEGLISPDELSHLTHFFDARNLPCPMPLLKAKITLRDVAPNGVLYLLATDKNSQIDLVAYCQKNKLPIKTWAYGQTDTIFHFLITKNP